MKFFYVLSILLVAILFMSGCGEDGKQGVEGSNSLISVVDEPAGENCDNGGKKVLAGIDNNSDGILDEDEIVVTDYICNGIDGEDGTDGVDGTNGTDGVDGTH